MRRVRLCCLRDLDEMLSTFYPMYNERVGVSYSQNEEKVLVKIVRQIAFQIDVSEKSEPAASSVLIRAEEGCFRFVLPEKHLFDRDSRLQCLLQLDEFLTGFFTDYGSDMAPFTYRERAVLKRIRKLFIHQLKGTCQYEKFKKKCPPRSSRLSEQEKQELLNQQKDERRLKAVCGNIIRYNPLSEKYKALKAETLRKIEQMG